MKKFISIVLLFALLLTCCSCGKKTGEGETQVLIRDEKDMTPEEMGIQTALNACTLFGID